MEDKLTLTAIRKNNNLEKITPIVTACRNSGMTAKEWCRQNGYNIDTYYKWQQKVFKAAKETMEAGTFADITPAVRTSKVSITTPDGITIGLSAPDPETVSAVIKGIRNA